MTGVVVNDKEIKEKLKELKSNNFKKYLKRVTGIGLAVAKKAAQQAVVNAVEPGGKSLKRYIKTSIYRDDPGRGNINILGRGFTTRNKETKQKVTTHPFYLRFFETGTKERFLTKRNDKELKSKKSIGKIPTYNFFSRAMQGAESLIFSQMHSRLEEVIRKIDSKN